MLTTNGRPVRMLLVYPDYTDRDCTAKVSGGNYMEGLASISAVLKQGGHDCRLLHLLYLHSEQDYKNKLRLMKEQYGPAMQVFTGLKKSLDPNNIMNPFKLGL